MVMFKVNVRPIAEKFSRLTWAECGLCPVFACYTLAFVLPMRDETTYKISVRLVAKCQLGAIRCVDMAALRVTRTSCRTLYPCLRGLGLGLGQRRYLPNCGSKRFLHIRLLLCRITQRSDVVGKERDSPNHCEYVCYQCTKVHW